jgi:hypothetical protein
VTGVLNDRELRDVLGQRGNDLFGGGDGGDRIELADGACSASRPKSGLKYEWS